MQILTQSRNSDNEFNQTFFPTENVRLLSESAGFALWTYAPPVVGDFQGGHGKANLLWGAVRALCRNAPLVVPSSGSNASVSQSQVFRVIWRFCNRFWAKILPNGFGQSRAESETAVVSGSRHRVQDIVQHHPLWSGSFHDPWIPLTCCRTGAMLAMPRVRVGDLRIGLVLTTPQLAVALRFLGSPLFVTHLHRTGLAKLVRQHDSGSAGCCRG